MERKIDPFKKVWGDHEWSIYLKNLKHLCKKHYILQKDFNQIVGVVAAFRRDINRPSNDIIKTICDHFKVSTDWILEYHDDFELDAVKQSEPAYDPQGGYKPDPEKSLGVERGTQQWKAFELLSKIYESKDQQLIEATFRNLKTFSDLVERMSKKHDGD